MDAFDIERSLSAKGTPYDDAVAEAMFKTSKTEFINDTVFPSQQALDLELFEIIVSKSELDNNTEFIRSSLSQMYLFHTSYIQV